MGVLPDTGVISFARGIPSPDMFPIEQLAESSRRAIERHGRVALNYGAAAGFRPLREWLADRHGVAPERIVVTPGSLVAMHFLVRHLLPTPRRTLVEAPTYDRTLHLLRGAGAEVVTVDRTDDGVDLDRIEELAQAEPRPAFLYVLPTFHNPTGRSLTLPQRERLAGIAIAQDLLVVEDDPYGLLRLDGEPQPYVHQILRDRGADDLAVLMSSFSKTVAPGLRVGYLVLPERLVAPIEALATSTYVSPPLLPQAELYEFLHAGHLEPHLDGLRAFLRPRRDALLDVLVREMPETVGWTRPAGGYFLWLDLPAGLDASELLELAHEVGVSFVPGAGFFAGPGGERSARLSFSFPSVDEVRVGAQRLTGLVREAVAAA